MEKEILYKFSEDNNGKIIRIENAIVGEEYFCPECKDKFILKNGKIRQRHFAHSNPTINCSSEGYLHKTFKKILLEKIIKDIKENSPIDIVWRCNVCKKEHNYNLLNGICDAKEEYYMEVCRPDIALINEKGKVSAAIEIIDTHEPEKGVVEYYINNTIILMTIKLNSLVDLENLEEKIKYPSNVIYHNLVCPDYRLFLANRNRIYRQPVANRVSVRKNMSDFMNWVDNSNSGKFYGSYYKGKHGNVHRNKRRK
jgi:hypothetical protein